MTKNIVISFLLSIFISACLFALFSKPKVKVLVDFTEEQYNYVLSNVVPDFEETNDCRVELINVYKVDTIPQILMMGKSNISISMVPFIYSWSLVEKNLINPIDNFLPTDDIDQFRKNYVLTYFGRKDRIQYFLPRKYDTRVMVYNTNMLTMAQDSFPDFKDSINIVLKSINGVGLPSGYVFENEPKLWSYYDIFTVGYIWSKIHFEDGQKPRIAHRAKLYSGTVQRIIDRIYQIGGDSTAVLSMNSPEVADAFHWEAAYRWAGIYNERMFQEKWDGKNIWGGFKTNDVFLSFLTQVDCFAVYGNTEDSLSGYIRNKKAFGVSVLPFGASLKMNDKGYRARVGSRSATTGGWWWAIPKGAKRPDLAYNFFATISNKYFQNNECIRFGMIPIRKDIISDKKLLYENGMKSEILRVSYEQIKLNDKNVLPSDSRFAKIEKLYEDAWKEIVLNKNWSADETLPPNYDYIKKLLDTKYVSVARKILQPPKKD